MCIVETWLNHSILDCELNVPHYCLIRLDRNRHGGGVLLYIREDLSYNIAFTGPENLELLGVTLHHDNSNRFCLCVLYSPPATTQCVLQQLYFFLQKVNPTLFSNFVIIGDFNVNALDTSTSLYHSLLDIMSSFNLFQVVQEPTRMALCGTATLIDLALMSNPSSLYKCSVTPPLSNSDHNGIELQIRWRCASQKSCPRSIWKYSLADYGRACAKIEDFDWDTQLLGRNIEEAWQLWQNTFMSIMEECIPKQVLPKKRKLPWVNAELRHIIRKRNLFYHKSKNKPDLRVKYNQLRNKVTCLLRSGKRSFVQNMRAGNAKEFWRSVKLLAGKKSSTIPVLEQNGRRIMCNEQKADTLNFFFHSCFNTALPPLSSTETERLNPDECPSELFCSEEEVFELLINLDITKASGPDGISARMLRGTASSVAPVLTQLFNYSIRTGKLPLACKSSNIVPIPKGSNSIEVSNYRPISLLSITSKVLEKVIYKRILN